MDQLIPITQSPGGKIIVSARDLHLFLEVGTRMDIWIRRRISDYGFAYGADYHGPILDNGSENPGDWLLTLDMAKELAMVEKNEKGQQLRRYFIWAEARLREVATAPAVPVLPTDFATALRLLADNVEKVAEQQRHLDGQRAQLLEQAPKVALANQIAKATNSVSFAEAAKMLKLPGVSGRNTLFTLLRTDGILRQNREPYQRYVDAGYFEVEGQVYEPGKKEEKGTHGTRIAVTTRLTGKGLTWLTGRYAVGTSIVII